MMKQRSFYFLRHGQTDFNCRPYQEGLDHPPNICLNQRGRQQALRAQAQVLNCKIPLVYTSPLQRVQETYAIIFSKQMQENIVLDDFNGYK